MASPQKCLWMTKVGVPLHSEAAVVITLLAAAEPTQMSVSFQTHRAKLQRWHAETPALAGAQHARKVTQGNAPAADYQRSAQAERSLFTASVQRLRAAAVRDLTGEQAWIINLSLCHFTAVSLILF